MIRFRLPVTVLLFAATATVQAQQLRGVVRDSATRQPVAGATIVLLSARDSALGQTTTAMDGAFAVGAPAPGGAAHLRVIRIGFVPRDVTLSASADLVEIALVRVPPVLDAVRVAANSRCRRNDSEDRAIALWKEARMQLLAGMSVQPEATDSTSVMNVIYHTVMLNSIEDPDDFRFRPYGMTSMSAFVTARTALERFLADTAGRDPDRPRTARSPDQSSAEDALLGDSFINAHCFKIERSGDHDRDTVIVFQLARGNDAPVALEGKLWIYGLHAGLRLLEFQYVHPSNPCHDGPQGSVLYEVGQGQLARITDWWLRCQPPSPNDPRAMGGVRNGPQPAPRPKRARTQWGEWNGLTTWVGSAASVTGTVISSETKRPLAGVRVILTPSRDESYVGMSPTSHTGSTTTDSAGRFHFTEIDNRYSTESDAIQIIDTTLSAYRSPQFGLRPEASFDRGYLWPEPPPDTTPHDGFRINVHLGPGAEWRPVIIVIEHSSVEQSFRDACGRSVRSDSMGIIIGHVFAGANSEQGAARAHVTARWAVAQGPMSRDARADAQGYFYICGVPRGRDLSLSARSTNAADSVVQTVTSRHELITPMNLRLAGSRGTR